MTMPNPSPVDSEQFVDAGSGPEGDLTPEQVEADLALEAEVDSERLAEVAIATHKLAKRQRRIEAQITVPYTCDQVWQVLTDYEGLADFIPNLAVSQRLEHPEGGIRIEQVGTQNALFLKFSARVILDMVETYPHAIDFEMVEGDFNSFTGTWGLTPIESPAEAATQLSYRLDIGPKRITPVFAIEQRLRHDLPRNLVAIRQRLDTLHAA